MIVEHIVPESITVDDVVHAARQDPDICELIELVRESADVSKVPERLSAYKRVYNELNVAKNGVLLRGQRLVVPFSLREKTVAIGHRGHQGIVKTKALVRSSPAWTSWSNRESSNAERVKQLGTSPRMSRCNHHQCPNGCGNTFLAIFLALWQTVNTCLSTIVTIRAGQAWTQSTQLRSSRSSQYWNVYSRLLANQTFTKLTTDHRSSQTIFIFLQKNGVFTTEKSRLCGHEPMLK